MRSVATSETMVLMLIFPIGFPGRGLCPLRRIGPQYLLLIVEGDKNGQKSFKCVTLRHSVKSSEVVARC